LLILAVSFLASIVVCTVTSIVLKFTWYDRLGPGEMYLASQAEES
jgi:hypothetical protein